MKLLGEAAVKANLDKQLNIIAKNATEALEEIGQRGVGIAKNNAPVISGRLRQSMDYEVKGSTVVIGTNLVYAQKVEFFSKTGSKGFFLKSYNQIVPLAKEIFRKVLKV